jgi:hypothetical protein
MAGFSLVDGLGATLACLAIAGAADTVRQSRAGRSCSWRLPTVSAAESARRSTRSVRVGRDFATRGPGLLPAWCRPRRWPSAAAWRACWRWR